MKYLKATNRAGWWLERHGWKLLERRPHGYATTHIWRNPHDGGRFTQTYALIEQRDINKRQFLTDNPPFDSPEIG